MLSSLKVVSPFAAVVFERCNGNRSRLITEVQRIRDELRPTRERLRQLEWASLWDKRSESIKAEGKIQKVLDELAQHFGPHPGLITWEKGIAFGKDTGDIADNPTSVKAWLSTLLKLPAEIATRLAYRRPVAEIHHLQQKLPGPRSLQKSIHDLFGELRD